VRRQTGSRGRHHGEKFASPADGRECVNDLVTSRVAPDRARLSAHSGESLSNHVGHSVSRPQSGPPLRSPRAARRLRDDLAGAPRSPTAPCLSLQRDRRLRKSGGSTPRRTRRLLPSCCGKTETPSVRTGCSGPFCPARTVASVAGPFGCRTLLGALLVRINEADASTYKLGGLGRLAGASSQGLLGQAPVAVWRKCDRKLGGRRALLIGPPT
jgi:hypothetical protein